MKRLKELNLKDKQNWDAKLDLQRSFQQGKLAAFLDTSAGLTYADKVCLRPHTENHTTKVKLSLLGLYLGAPPMPDSWSPICTWSRGR
jgi:hypothetical protein